MILAMPGPTSRRLLHCAAVALLFGIVPASADSVTPASPPTLCELKRLDACELDQLFARGSAAALPVGAVRGHILFRTEGKLPRLRTRLGGAVWKGKYFYDDGCFINQWVGFRAISSSAVIAPSWFDGQPCIVLEYPSGTPIFANTRDELREIAPGLYLGRFYHRCPCPLLQGYFVLEREGCDKID